MALVFDSKLKKGLTNGRTVKFNIGDVVKYKLENGKVLDIEITSEYMQHHIEEIDGYEAIFSDDGKSYFAVAERIIDWEGKVE